MDNIVTFLQGIHLNDNKEWYMANRESYAQAFYDNAQYIQQLIKLIGDFDETIRYHRLPDCSYALLRPHKLKLDTRKYNDYLGGFFARAGKNSGYGGYYYHISPLPSDSGGSLLAAGIFNPSRELLTAFRHDAEKNGATIMELIRRSGFKLLERDKFIRMPSGFNIEPEYRDLLLQRHIMIIKRVDISWFYHEKWLERTARQFRNCKPFIDYINNIVTENNLYNTPKRR